LTLLAARDLRFDYGAGAFSLSLDVLELEAGGTLACIGPSGCGKTTLLRVLAGFYQPDAGRVLFDERDVTTVPPHRRNTGMVFQNYALWPHLSVRENVAYGLAVRGLGRRDQHERVARVLDMVRMGGYESRLPAQLSGGQQQRLCIARTIAVRPEVILMDEPCSALDPIATAIIEELIDELREKYTIAIVTHSMQQASRVSQRTAYFHLGDLIEIGSTERIFTRPRHQLTEDYITGRFG